MAVLLVKEGPQCGLEIRVSTFPFRIGRTDDNDLVLSDNNVSRQHAQIVKQDNNFFITDTSSNGTFVNGNRITSSIIKNGDIIQFCDARFTFEFVDNSLIVDNTKQKNKNLGGDVLSSASSFVKGIEEKIKSAPMPNFRGYDKSAASSENKDNLPKPSSANGNRDIAPSVILFLIGFIAWFFCYTNVKQMETGVGILGRLFSQDLSSQYQIYKIIQFGSYIFMILGAVFFIVKLVDKNR